MKKHYSLSNPLPTPNYIIAPIEGYRHKDLPHRYRDIKKLEVSPNEMRRIISNYFDLSSEHVTLEDQESVAGYTAATLNDVASRVGGAVYIMIDISDYKEGAVINALARDYPDAIVVYYNGDGDLCRVNWTYDPDYIKNNFDHRGNNDEDGDDW